MPYDKNIVIRTLRYGFEKARETPDLTDLTRPVEMEFPNPRIIFIEENQEGNGWGSLSKPGKNS